VRAEGRRQRTVQSFHRLVVLTAALVSLEEDDVVGVPLAHEATIEAEDERIGVIGAFGGAHCQWPLVVVVGHRRSRRRWGRRIGLIVHRDSHRFLENCRLFENAWLD